MTNSTRARAFIRAVLIRYARVVAMEDVVNDVAQSLGVFPLKAEQLKAILKGKDSK